MLISPKDSDLLSDASTRDFGILCNVWQYSPRTPLTFYPMLVGFPGGLRLPLDACLVFHELWSSLRCLLAVPEYTGFLVDACWFSFSIPAFSRMFVGFSPRIPDFSPQLGLSVVVILSGNIISMIKVGLLMSTFRRTLSPLSSHLVSLCLSII